MKQSSSYPLAGLVICAALLVASMTYVRGLSGPFLLDDLPNLLPLQQWLDGQASATELIFGNRSGILGRPVSMATLWLSAATGGLHPFPFKLGNLLIHLVCGLVGWQLLRRMLERDPHLSQRANLVAAVLAGLWLVHPINVSTVLYAVQRMAQLGALFTLLAVWMYMLARVHLVDGEVRRACIKLFGAFPLLLLLGLFSKENAAVAPALCLVVEIAYFLGQPRNNRLIKAFYGLFLLLPAILAVALLVDNPDRVLGGYATRDFTLVERLLSQPRALIEYLGLILWPRGGMIGVYVDDFAASTGLLAPISTLLAILTLFAISLAAIMLRKQTPSFFAGWFFFLVAHSVESTFLPLELYFDHRNYLPSFGVLLAMVGILVWAAKKAGLSECRKLEKMGFGMAVILMAGYASITWQQVAVWRSVETLTAQALQHRPNSLRAILSMNTIAVHAGRWEESRVLTSRLIDSANPRHRVLGNIYELTVNCIRGVEGDPAYLHQAERADIHFLTLGDADAFKQLGKVLDLGLCGPGVTYANAADTIDRMMQMTPSQADSSQPKWLLRTTAADFYRRAGFLEKAQHQAERAWQPGISDTAIAGLLIHLYIQNGNKTAAQRTLDQVRHHVAPSELAATREIERLQQVIDTMKN